MKNPTKKFLITYDSSAGDKFILKKDSEQLIFSWSPSGLYFHDAGACDILMVGITKKDYEGYNIQEVAADTKVQAGLDMVGNTSAEDYIKMVRSGQIHNFPITPQAVTIANTIFGPGIAALKGKTTSKYSEPVVIDYVEILQRILDLNKEVTLAEYLMFLNGIGFFVITCRIIKFTTIKYLPSCTKGK